MTELPADKIECLRDAAFRSGALRFTLRSLVQELRARPTSTRIKPHVELAEQLLAEIDEADARDLAACSPQLREFLSSRGALTWGDA